MKPLFKAYLNGVMTRGSGGVVYVKGDMCGYVFPKDFSDATFRGNIETLVEEQSDKVMVVEERDGAMNVHVYEKKELMSDFVASSLVSKK
jgi:hypothetical protein